MIDAHLFLKIFFLEMMLTPCKEQYKQLMNTHAKKISRLLAADTNILLSKVGIVLRP